MEAKMHGSSAHVKRFNSSIFNTYRVAMFWDYMQVMNNIIRDLEESHRKCTSTTFSKIVYDQCGGIITVTVDQIEVPEDVNDGSLINRQMEANGVLRLQYNILVTIFDGHHNYYDTPDFRKIFNSEYNWTWEPLPVFPTLLMNEKEFLDKDMAKNRKLLNTSYPTVLSCN